MKADQNETRLHFCDQSAFDSVCCSGYHPGCRFRRSRDMLSLLGPRGRLCDSPSRRELLSVGSLPLLGLALPEVLRSKARARGSEPKVKVNGFGKANSVLLLYLQGSPSHIDTWDPKPDAADGIRGEFKTIATRV